MKKIIFNGIFPHNEIAAYLSSDYSRILKEVIRGAECGTLVVMYDQAVERSRHVIAETRKASNVPIIEVPVTAGEDLKSLDKLCEVSTLLSNHQISSSSIMLIIGGGTVCNFGGYVAGSWKGMEPVMVPTTYTAICDVAVGSLHMLNVGEQKNAMRIYYDPLAIIIDRLFINSLPAGERRNGIVETLKHALCQDEQLFRELEGAIEDRSVLNDDVLYALAIRTAELKSDLIGVNPFGQLTKAILSYGHTIGHAIEAVSHYHVSHGEAVSLGILCEIAVFNDVNSELYRTVHGMLERLGLPVVLPSTVSSEDTVEFLQRRYSDGALSIPHVENVGNMKESGGSYYVRMDMEAVANALNNLI